MVRNVNFKCRVEVNGLKLRAYHGVLPQERVTGNTFRVDLSLDYPFERAMTSDVVNDTLSYADVVEIVKREMAIPSALLEHVAGRIIDSLLRHFPRITGGRLRLSKLTPPLDAIVTDCAVVVEW